MKFVRIATLEKGWHDTDVLLLHVSFQLLVDFMEKEQPGKSIDWSSDESHRKTWKEIERLYHWWKHERPTRRSPLDDRKIKRPPFRRMKIAGSENSELVQHDRNKYPEYYTALKLEMKLERKWFEEDQHNLHALIAVREHLWT